MNNRCFPTCLVVMMLALAPLSVAHAAKARIDPATVTLAADLHTSPETASAVVATLAAGQQVMVLGMQGALARVDADGKVGWMPASKLRIGTGAAPSSSQGGSAGDSSFFRGLSGLLGGGSSSDSGAKVPIGVRGLQKKDLATAEPDPAAVDRMETFKATVGDGQAHARAAGLESHTIEYRKTARGPASSGGAPATRGGADN